MTLTYSIIKQNINSDFNLFENQIMREDIKRLNNIISYDIKQLERLTIDWSTWDDSYAFIDDLNEEYITSNLNVATFRNIKINYFAYLDNKLNIVYGKQLQPSNDFFEEISPSEKIVISELAKYHLQKDNSNPTSSLITLDNTVCLFSLQTITKTDGNGDKNYAFLFFASAIDSTYIKQLGDITQSHIAIYNNPINYNNPTKSYSTKTINDNTIKGLLTLNNYLNQPIITLAITNTRDIYQYGQLITKKFSIILPILCIIIGFIAHFAMKILVINRVTRLRKHIQHYTRNPEQTESIKIEGRSEIADLATDFNTLINTINNTQKKLNHALNTAHNATQAKTDFIANMSHEIRTPMTAILGYNNLLKTTSNEEERLSYINTIEKNGEHLLCIINEILDISKIEANELSITIQKTELLPVLQEACALMQLSAIEKGLKFSVKSLTDIPESIDTDASRLKQVLINLIGNAIKFTSKGSVSILIDTCHIDKTISISIKDTGIGLDKDSLEKIFTPFYQVESSTTRKFQGTGLGLTIAKDLTEKLGGKLCITSQPDKGSTFSVILPIHQTTRSLIPVSPQSPQPQLQLQDNKSLPFMPEKQLQGEIFVIDDNPVILTLISKILRNFGLTVYSEQESRVAISKLLDGNHHADIVFMDMQMPTIDGYTATQYLITNGFAKPIIAVTANTMEGDKEKCLLAGCSEFISKPIDPKKLYDACQRFLP